MFITRLRAIFLNIIQISINFPVWVMKKTACFYSQLICQIRKNIIVASLQTQQRQQLISEWSFTTSRVTIMHTRCNSCSEKCKSITTSVNAIEILRNENITTMQKTKQFLQLYKASCLRKDNPEILNLNKAEKQFHLHTSTKLNRITV